MHHSTSGRRLRMPIAPSTVLEREHKELVDSFEAFIRREVEPLEAEIAADADLPEAKLRGHVRRRSADLGFYAGDYPVELGGAGMPFSAMVALHHAAGRTGCRLALFTLAGPEGPSPLLLRGSPYQRKTYLEPLVRAEKTRCLAMTETASGSDAFHMRTVAQAVAGGWVLSGEKTFVSNAEHADFALVVAAVKGDGGRSRPAVFVVEMDNPGLHVGQQYRGMSGETLHELLLCDAIVSDDALVSGRETTEDAWELSVDSLSRGRIIVAAQCNGIAEYALALGVRHARERHAFGQAIGRFQHVQEHLVSSRAEIEGAKLLTLAAARLLDEGAGSPEHAALAKLTASTTAVRVVDRSLQIHGAGGWTRGHPLEFLYRYTRMMTIVEGPTEVQKVIVAQSLGLG